MNYSLVTFISFLNIFLSVILLIFNWKKNRRILLLSLFLLIFSLYGITTSLFNDGGSVWLFAVLLNNFAPFYYLYPVLLFFYVRTTLTDSLRFRKYDFLHFIPFVINFIAIVPYLLTSFDYKYSIAEKLMCNFHAYMEYDFKLFYPHMINQIVRPVQFIIYLIYCIILIFKFNLKFKASTGLVKHQFNYMIITLSVIVAFFLMISLIHIYIAVYQMIYSNPHETFISAKRVFRLISNIYFILPLFILLNPRFLYGLPQNKVLIKETANNKGNVDSITQNSVQKSTILKVDENDYFKLLSNRIMNYLELEKPYLNMDFSVQDICYKLNAPRHHVQYCFNVIMNKKFADIKNEMRVNYAKELILSDTSRKISMEGIGKNAGFASASNFFLTFKKITGTTPGEWLKENKENVTVEDFET